MSPERLASLLRDAAPEPDFEIELQPQPIGATAAVVAFAGHIVIGADVPLEWVSSYCPPGDLIGPIQPRFLAALAERCACTDFSTTVTFALLGLGNDPEGLLVPTAERTSARVQRSMRVRTEVRVYETVDHAGLLVIGRGLAGRWEAGFEVRSGAQGKGLGRRMAAAARGLVPASEPLFMQAVPGNIPSLRALIGAGFKPVASEVLMW